MDKFVVKTPRTLNSTSSPLIQNKKLQKQQSKLESLAGVVVIEDLEEANTLLKSGSSTNEKKIQILRSLKKKKPAKEVLTKVEIGRTIRKLRKVI